MKIASHVLAFNQEKWILQNLENSGPFVDKIYVSYSRAPWIYNRNARNEYENHFDPESLKKSPYWSKIEFIEGEWDYDEDQRNACAEAASRDGMDYLLTHDADEFYFLDDFERILTGIKKNPDFEYYTTPWISFWKSFDYVLLNYEDKTTLGYPEVAINLKKGVRFKRCRVPNGRTMHRLNALCYHATFVISDEECWNKINTWGHSHQFNTKRWYNEKWLQWNLDTRNLHPVSPRAWKKAVPYKGKLPEVCVID